MLVLRDELTQLLEGEQLVIGLEHVVGGAGAVSAIRKIEHSATIQFFMATLLNQSQLLLTD